MHRKSTILLPVIFLMFAALEASAVQLHPAVAKMLEALAPNQKLAVIVELNEQARPNEVVAKLPRDKKKKDRIKAVVKALKDVADKSQVPIHAYLRQQQAKGAVERIVPFWIINGFGITASESVIRNLASRPEVREIRPDAEIPLPNLTPTDSPADSYVSEWNIDFIRAPEVWSMDPGYNGTGAVVGSFDTGVDLIHPDLFSRYRGNHRISWFDPYEEHSFPVDLHGHGTHTTGTAVGGDAGGTHIGVAPGATWIAAKGWNDAGGALASAFHLIFQWFLAPGGDPENAPDVVINSWAFEEPGCETEFLLDVQAWRAAGIFPAFASGNDGPDPESVRSPGAYPISFTVGASDYFDEVAYFSGQGPSPCDGSIKPDISAPGDGILSAIPGGYAILSGTSMATPHIAGAVAVLRSIDPSLTVDQLESALTLGARDIGVPGPDNASGNGRLDLYVSAQIALMGPDFPVVKVVATEADAAEAGPTSGVFTLSRTGDTGEALEVKYALAGSATPGSDFVPIPDRLIIPAGSDSLTVLVTPIDDTLAEFDETVSLTIIPDSAYIVSGTDSAEVTIVSDELIPDLTVPSMSAPLFGGAGESIIVTDTTRNLGAGAADPSVTNIYLSTNSFWDAADLLIASRNVPALAAGASSSGSTTATIPAATSTGLWYLIARADGDGVLIETSENNNAYGRPIQIGPDLMISSLSAPTTAGAGDTITVNDTTKNQGGGGAASSVTHFYLSSNGFWDAEDLLIASRSIPALAAGSTDSGSTFVTLPASLETGLWYIIAKADGAGALPETSENNNTYSRSVQIGPDLSISALSAPTSGGAGQTIVMTDTTRNQGGGTAAPSLTRFYLSANGFWDPGDLPLGGRNVPSLAGGLSSTGNTTVTIPVGTGTGLWYLIARADGEEILAETSENNNTYARSIQIGPDLIMASLSAPTSAGAGQSISITETTRNQGGGEAGPSTTRLFLSTNGSYGESDILIGTRSVPALSAGASSSGSTNVTIPADTAAGTWYIVAYADGEGAVAETIENNNSSGRSILIGPDLTITSLSAPTTGGAGQSIVLTDSTRNQGQGTTPLSMTQFYLSGNGIWDAGDLLIGARSVPSLASGASSVGSTTVTIPAGTTTGLWYIIAKADGEEVVTETSENNNTYARSIQIGPDLYISALSAPTSGGAGQNITITDTTRNQGGGTAEPSVTQLFLSPDGYWDAADVLLGDRSVPALAVGASNSGSLTVTIPAETSTGLWYLIAKADGTDLVAESSESNNTYARSIRVGPDLTITSLSAPTVAGAGQVVLLTDTTRNQGGGTATPTVTRLFLSNDGYWDASDLLIGSRNVPALAAGSSSSGSSSVTIPEGTPTGLYYFIAQADGEETQLETYETNNTYGRSVRIGPDLTVASIAAPSSVLAGQSLTVTESVRNQGGGAAAASVTQLFLSANSTWDESDLPLGSRSVPALEAGATSSGSTSVAIPAGSTPGLWYIIVRADGEDSVLETLENNNVYARSIRIN